jgi:hypothetical protein
MPQKSYLVSTSRARVAVTLLCLSITAFFTLPYILSSYVSVASTAGGGGPAGLAPQDDPEANKPHWLVGSYYSTQDGLTATLLLNNKGNRPLEVRPTLYSLGGEAVEIPPITVEAASFRYVNLQDWAAAGGESFSRGSIKLFHVGKDLVLGAQIYLVDEAHSLSFEEKLAEVETFNSVRLEGVWWMPSRRAEVQVVLSNTTDAPLSVTGRLAKRPHRTGDAQDVLLGPHETRVLDLRRDFADGERFAEAEIIALSLEHPGAKSALLARAMVKDSRDGYSNVVQFSNPGGGKSSEYQGAGFQIGNVSGEPLTPVIVVRNVGGEEATVRARVPYTRADDTTGLVELPDTRLRAGEMRLLDTRQLTQRSQQEQIQLAGLEVEYDTPPGSVLASAHSVSASGNQVFRVPMWDPLGQRSPTGGYPWRIEGTSRTRTYIKNITDRTQYYVAYLRWENGGEYMLGMKPVGPRQTVEIDVKRLRDEQAPDVSGRTIPPGVSSGQLLWSLKQTAPPPAGEGERQALALIGRTEQVDVERAVSSNYACQSCCSNSYNSSFVSPGGPTADVNTQVNFTVYQTDKDCYGTLTLPYPRTDATWTSGNTAVATASGSGQVTTLAGGQTTIRATWTDYRYDLRYVMCSDYGAGAPNCYDCNNPTEVHPNPSATLQVNPGVQKIQYKRDGTWTDVPSGGLSSICPGSGITFRAVAAGGATWPTGRPTWGGDASGTGEEKTVTFSNSGSRTVTAASGNTVSVSVNVGPANGAVPVTWLPASVTTNTSTGNSSANDKAFTVEYTACADINNNVWRMRLKKIEGGIDIVITTGGYRNPDTNPPVSQTEAQSAVTVMKAYYTQGKGSWHTPAASRAHEDYHYTEWQCSGDHYWPATETAIENLTAPYTSHANEAAAITALRGGAGGADAKITAYTNITRDYWATLSDTAPSRPYAAGQLALNPSIVVVQNLAATNGWSVPSGTDNPSTATPCYQSWLPYTP